MNPARADTARSQSVSPFLLSRSDAGCRRVDAKGTSGPSRRVEVAVPTDRLEEAAAALARREKAFASATEGEATLMTDEGPAEIDPTETGSN